MLLEIIKRYFLNVCVYFFRMGINFWEGNLRYKYWIWRLNIFLNFLKLGFYFNGMYFMFLLYVIVIKKGIYGIFDFREVWY